MRARGIATATTPSEGHSWDGSAHHPFNTALFVATWAIVSQEGEWGV